MKIENIEKLKRIKKDRESPTGYMLNKERIYIVKENLRRVAIVGDYENIQFNKYIIKESDWKYSKYKTREWEKTVCIKRWEHDYQLKQYVIDYNA